MRAEIVACTRCGGVAEWLSKNLDCEWLPSVPVAVNLCPLPPALG